MIANELIERYCEDLKKTKADETVTQSRRILTHVQEYEQLIGKDLVNFTLEDFGDMFAQNKWARGYGSFYRNKSLIIAFIQWLRSNGEFYSFILDDLIPSKVDPANSWEDYFMFEDEFLQAIDAVVGDESSVRERTISALYWSGLTREEAINLKAQDLDESSLTILGRKVSQKIFAIVKECNDTRGYDTVYEYSNGTIRVISVQFGKSDYVLKVGTVLNLKENTPKEIPQGEDAKITIDTVNKFFKTINRRFSELSPVDKFYDRRFKYATLSNNGLFVKVNEIERTSGISFDNPKVIPCNELIRDVLKDYGVTSENAVFYKWRQYNEWKKYFWL